MIKHFDAKKLSWNFRGRNAAASLKQQDAKLVERPHGEFPRQKCRGLIEAFDVRLRD